MAYPTFTSSSGVKTTSPAISAGTTGVAKRDITIQNQSTATLYVKLGAGASSSDYDYSLKGCTSAGDGNGGGVVIDFYPDSEVISVSSADLKYTVSYR